MIYQPKKLTVSCLCKFIYIAQIVLLMYLELVARMHEPTQFTVHIAQLSILLKIKFRQNHNEF